MQAIPQSIPSRFQITFIAEPMGAGETPCALSAGSYSRLLNSFEEARRAYFSKVLPVLPPGQMMTPRHLEVWLPESLDGLARGTIACGITRVGSETFDWVAEARSRSPEKTVAVVLVKFGLVDRRIGTSLPLPVAIIVNASDFEGAQNINTGGP